MEYQYGILHEELKRYSEDLSERPFAVAITKIDALGDEEANRRSLELIESLGLESNSSMSRFGADSSLVSYGSASESWEDNPEGMPVFILPISAVSGRNSEALRYALGDMVTRARRSSRSEIDEDGGES
jgi:GTP-binding protein